MRPRASVARKIAGTSQLFADGGKDIDGTDEVVARSRFPTGISNHKRHVNDALVYIEAVPLKAPFVPEFFTVIRREHKQDLVEQLPLDEGIDNAA